MQSVSHFFAVSPLASKRLSVRGLGVLESCRACIVNRPRGSGDYLLSYFYDPVWLAASELPRPYPAGTLMIFSPGRWQYFGNREAPFRYSYLHVDGEIFRYLIGEYRLPVDEPTSLDSGEIIERALAGINDELSDQPQADIMIVRNLLDTMARRIAQKLQTQLAQRQIPKAFLVVRRQIELEYNRKLPIASLAAQTGLSVSRFGQQFRRYFGLPPHEYQLRQRLQRAAYLLGDRSLTVAAVARAVGYTDVPSFSRLFKQQFRLTPSKLRAKDPDGH